MQQERFGRQQREGGTDLQSESSKEMKNEENNKQLTGETRGEKQRAGMHLHPPALEKKRTLIYTLMTQGAKYKRFCKEALVVGSVAFFK